MSQPAPPPPPYTGTPATEQHQRPGGGSSQGLAITALVVGIVAFLTGLVPVLGLLLGVAAVVLGILGVRRASAGTAGGRGLSLTGLVLGGLAALTGLVVLLLAVLGLALGSVTSTEGPVTVPELVQPSPDTTPAPAVPGPEDPAAPAAGIGEAVTAPDGAQFTVTAFACGIPSVGEEPLASVPQGEYCQLDLTLTNTGQQAVLFDGSSVRAYAGDVEYEADAEAGVFTGGNSFFEDVNPGNTLTSVLYFDVPPGTPLDRVVLGADPFGGGSGVTVRLS